MPYGGSGWGTASVYLVPVRGGLWRGLGPRELLVRDLTDAPPSPGEGSGVFFEGIV